MLASQFLRCALDLFVCVLDLFVCKIVEVKFSKPSVRNGLHENDCKYTQR